jgi:hypothetical protein
MRLSAGLGKDYALPLKRSFETEGHSMIPKSLTIFSAGLLTAFFLTPTHAEKGSSHAASTQQQKYSAPYKPSGTNKGGNGPGVLSGKRVTGKKVLQMKEDKSTNTAGQQKKEDLQNKKREQNEAAGQQEQNKPQAKQGSSSSPVDTFMPSKEPAGSGQKAPSDSGVKGSQANKDPVRTDDHRELGATGGVSRASSQDVQRVRK